jgi:NAD(P)-dependent dehydrogenase (short-subunit alcohol dehydrogenase family)
MRSEEEAFLVNQNKLKRSAKMGKLDGKVAIITGSGMGIGKRTALLFATEGAKVVVACRTVSNGEETVKTIKKAGGEAFFIRTDVSVAKDVENMVKGTVAKYGKLDIINNNAGVVEKHGPIHNMEEADWDRSMSIDLKGVFLGTKYAVPEMLKVGGGVIINSASVFGLVAFPGLAAYTASKFGVVGLTKTVALEYANKNIRVNAICPGTIWTEMMEKSALETAPNVEAAKAQSVKYFAPIGRVGMPEDVAKLALFLASDDSSYITGATITIDGGFSTSPHRGSIQF